MSHENTPTQAPRLKPSEATLRAYNALGREIARALASMPDLPLTAQEALDVARRMKGLGIAAAEVKVEVGRHVKHLKAGAAIGRDGSRVTISMVFDDPAGDEPVPSTDQRWNEVPKGPCVDGCGRPAYYPNGWCGECLKIEPKDPSKRSKR